MFSRKHLSCSWRSSWYLPICRAWRGQEGGDSSGTAATPKSCLVFTTDLDDSEVHFCPNSNTTSSQYYEELIEVEVTQYYDAGGNPRELPEGTKVTYKWYRDGRNWRSIPDKPQQSVIMMRALESSTGTYYATASATNDGVEYTGTSKILNTKLGIAANTTSITVNQKGNPSLHERW